MHEFPPLCVLCGFARDISCPNSGRCVAPIFSAETAESAEGEWIPMEVLLIASFAESAIQSQPSSGVADGRLLLAKRTHDAES